MWKRWFLFGLFWLLLSWPGSAQCQGFCVWLPTILSVENPCNIGGGMSDWKIIVPESTINYVMNPSGETTGNFSAEAGTTVTRSTTYQHYGLYSYRVETNANNEGIQFTLSALTNAIHYVTVRVRGTLPASWDWALDGATFTAPTLLEQIDSNWALYGLQFPAAQANGSVLLEIHQNGAGSGDFYLDGIQVEAKSYYTTYCDGTQEGCEWLGPENAATSQRSAASRAGGRVQDLEDDYNLKIGGMSGIGTPAQDLGVDKYAALPGGELNSLKIDSRVFTLTGVITGTSQSDFHSKKQTLLNALSPDTYPEDANGVQPVRLRYNGATIHKQIAAHYDGGLEGELSASEPCAWEKVAVRFFSPAPYFTEIGESAALLDTNDSATFRTVAGRLRNTGQWSALGPPNVAGSYNSILAIVEDATYIYFGGDYLNFDNIASADNIVRYNKSTGVWSALGSGLNGAVQAMTIAPNGNIIIAGIFTNAGGVADADHICSWDGSNFAALGTTPIVGGFVFNAIDEIIYDRTGILFISGDFLNWQNIANADNVVSWNGAAYAALSTGANARIRTLAVGLNNTLYLGGDFTSPFNYVMSWNGSAFAALAGTGGPSNIVYAFAINSVGILFVGWNNTPYLQSWNGQGWSTLGGGVDGSVRYLSISADDLLFAAGTFTEAGGLSTADYFARWNNYAWAYLDIDVPGTPGATIAFPSKYVDPVIKQKYDLWLGFNTTGTGNFAGKITATNDGNAPAFPKIIYERSGGTTAVIETLKNESTGKELLFNYSLLSGERLTIDLTPTQKSIVSNFFGPRPDAILANSDFGSWQLLKGDNNITSFVATTGSPTVTGWMLWKETFKSQD